MADPEQTQEGQQQQKQTAKPKPPAPPAKAPEATRWRLQNEIKVSLGGGMTTMRAGHVISLQHHGKDGVRKVISAGGKLEPISDSE